ncbi:Uncharacterised protein [BD1-7 clade bacterium]|uniref:Uncharacterized protein n=1 Tax=BD1-7 clade bacterium TaxID=2029982 RepID=A0A5S9P2G9_9GAMM|nr:Uncharacterised protein [BD1-7 clade bacterium]CAA0110020.1 Uncharacterised protein [BD1-7 clade bacterium]CAA0116604.1 Uncharacterised protein [BD1-7 clade bacterium]
MNQRQKIQAYCKIKWLLGGQCPILNDVKASYLTSYQIQPVDAMYQTSMNPARGMFIADAYDAIPEYTQTEVAKCAYAQMNEELLAQFEWMQKHLSLTIEPWPYESEPYKSSFDMLIDIHDHHLWYLKTADAFGHDCFHDTNPMLSDSGIRIGEYRLLMNDIFRIVHDVFGHAMNCNNFAANGEDQAWFDHSVMFSPLARIALTTETRGQNTWVNFGRHLRSGPNSLYRKGEENWTPPNQRPFAKQKIGMLPDIISGVRCTFENEVISTSLLPDWTPHTESYLMKNIQPAEHQL